LVWTDAVNDEVIYTFAENLNNTANYEVVLDVEKVAGNIHQFFIDGAWSNHSHTAELTEAQYRYLKDNPEQTLTVQQTDQQHANLYTHTFTIAHDVGLETATFILDGTPTTNEDGSPLTNPQGDPIDNTGDPLYDHPHHYSCSYDDFTKLKNGTIAVLDMSHLTQTDLATSHYHAIKIERTSEILPPGSPQDWITFTVLEDINDTHIHTTFIHNQLDSGMRILTQTFWEGHDDLLETGTTVEISEVTFMLGDNNNWTSETVMLNEVGIYNIALPGAIGNKAALKLKGSGIINSVRLTEKQVPSIDHNTAGISLDGTQTQFVRAGDYDSKLHIVGNVDKRPIELDSPFYYSRGFQGSIDDVSVKLVEEKWTFISETNADSYIDQIDQKVVTTGSGPNNRGIAHISFAVTEGGHYKVYLDVDRPTDSVVKVGPAPDDSQYALFEIADGSTEEHRDFVFTADATGICYLTLTTIGSGFTYWDNVSVKTIPNLTSDEYLLLGRALNVFGSEERWKQHHIDSENMDYTGQVLTGFRTMESYGENVVEQYYDVALRQEDLLDDLKVVWQSHYEAQVGDVVTIEGTGFKSGMILTIGGVEQVVTDVHIPTLITFVVDGMTPLTASDLVITTFTTDQTTLTNNFTRLP